MKPKLTAWLVIRTAAFLALFGFGGFMIFKTPGAEAAAYAVAGLALGVLCVETALPLVRALPMVKGRADFVLAAVQYVAVPVLGVGMLAAAIAAMLLKGVLTVQNAVKAAVTMAALIAMIVSFVRPAWKKYRRERGMSRAARLEGLERAYRQGGLTREAYLREKEAIYEQAWKGEKDRE